MRILLVTKNFPPLSCGVGDYACRLAEALSSGGDRVTVLTEPAGEPRRGTPDLIELPLNGSRDLRPILSAIAEAAPERVQLEYSGYAWGRWGTAWWVNSMLFRLRRRGIPVHVGLHELAIRMRQHPLQAPVALAQWLHVALIVAAAQTVAVNLRSRARLLGRLFPWWRAKVRYRPNSSTIRVVPFTEAERAALRRERGVSSGETVVATFGLFHRAKNYEGLIQAIAHLRRSRATHLWMLGNTAVASPAYIAKLKQIARDSGIEDAIWWPGKLEARQISEALQAADVFVLPQSDGHLTRSSAFMAAAAHALPVVAVSQPGGRDQAEFSHRENVWLAERSTAEELAAGIRALAGDCSAAARMGRNLCQLYKTRFDWPVTAAAECGIAKRAGSAEASGESGSIMTASTAGEAKS